MMLQRRELEPIRFRARFMFFRAAIAAAWVPRTTTVQFDGFPERYPAATWIERLQLIAAGWHLLRHGRITIYTRNDHVVWSKSFARYVDSLIENRETHEA